MIDLDNYVDFITEHKLSQQEFLMLILLYRGRWDLINKYKESFPTEDGSMIGEDSKARLIRDGWLKHIGDDTKASSYQLSKKFLSAFVDDYEAANEIWDMYPDTVEIGGKYLPLTLMDKQEFQNRYISSIKGVKKEHEEVKKDLQFAIDNDLVKFGIEKFIKSEYWRVLRKQRCVEEDSPVEKKRRLL